jgi:XRE family aerobic/anaerobic benzoate catabolism transcriptional regulator
VRSILLAFGEHGYYNTHVSAEQVPNQVPGPPLAPLNGGRGGGGDGGGGSARAGAPAGTRSGTTPGGPVAEEYGARHHSSAASNGQSLLLALGQRLRRAREAAGLSVAELARRANVSRRHVTEAEAGRANLTLLKLADLALPLGVSLAQLCDLPLSARGERYALIGLRGAGKTTVGRLLARELEARFVELDERIEARAGLSLAEIFDLHGVEAYRRHEREALEEVLAEGQRLVIATGGSLVTHEDTYDRLRAVCRTVWLRAQPEAHLARVQSQGDRRPMAGRPRALEELREILTRREPRYALADVTVDTDDRAPDTVAAEIAKRLASRA